MRREFTAEQKAEAVRLVKKVGNLAQVARDLDLHPNVLRKWVKQAEIDACRGPVEALSTEEKKEIQRLLRENKKLVAVLSPPPGAALKESRRGRLSAGCARRADAARRRGALRPREGNAPSRRGA